MAFGFFTLFLEQKGKKLGGSFDNKGKTENVNVAMLSC